MKKGLKKHFGLSHRELSSTAVEVGAPQQLSHKLHVDTNLSWHPKEDPVNSFVFQEKLGEGSFGSVHKVLHKDSQSVIAVKVVQMDEFDDSSDLKQEIEILRKCNSEYVVSYFGTCSVGPCLWILMDYCAMGSLRDILEVAQRTLEEQEIAYICSCALKGLAYLHDQDVIHRDVKGANLLITEHGGVKIGDFGVSTQLYSTLCSTVVGTPHWMAPEIIRQVPYSNAADIWSIGITAIELAEGLPPYHNVNAVRAMFMISRKDPPTLTDSKKWTKEFPSFISACLQKDPKCRPTALTLLQHPFITANKGHSALKDLIAEVQKKKKKKGGINFSLKSKTKQQSIEAPGAPYATVIVSDTVPGEKSAVKESPVATFNDNESTPPKLSDSMQTVFMKPPVITADAETQTDPISNPDNFVRNIATVLSVLLISIVVPILLRWARV